MFGMLLILLAMVVTARFDNIREKVNDVTDRVVLTVTDRALRGFLVQSVIMLTFTGLVFYL